MPNESWPVSHLLLGRWRGLGLGGLEDGGVLPGEDLLCLGRIALHGVLHARSVLLHTVYIAMITLHSQISMTPASALHPLGVKL
jgi:hypothetical protein